MIQLGLGLLIIGWLILLFQVIHVLPTSLFISFMGHGMSFIGMVVGLIGIVMYSTFKPKKY